MSLSARRHFFVQVLAAGTAATATPARAQARVKETDEQAAALGYRHDTAAVDGRKYPKHETSQHCGNCAFFQGQPSDAWAGCAMFGRKQIAKSGWCMAWAKAPG